MYVRTVCLACSNSEVLATSFASGRLTTIMSKLTWMHTYVYRTPPSILTRTELPCFLLSGTKCNCTAMEWSFTCHCSDNNHTEHTIPVTDPCSTHTSTAYQSHCSRVFTLLKVIPYLTSWYGIGDGSQVLSLNIVTCFCLISPVIVVTLHWRCSKNGHLMANCSPSATGPKQGLHSFSIMWLHRAKGHMIYEGNQWNIGRDLKVPEWIDVSDMSNVLHTLAKWELSFLRFVSRQLPSSENTDKQSTHAYINKEGGD